MVPFASCANSSSSPSTSSSRLLRSDGVLAVAAEFLILKHQLLISTQTRTCFTSFTSPRITNDSSLLANLMLDINK